MPLGLSRGLKPSRLGMGIGGMTGITRGVGADPPVVIRPMAKLTFGFLGRGEGVLAMPLIGSPIRGREFFMGIGGMTAETIIAVRLEGLQIASVAGEARGGAAGVG